MACGRASPGEITDSVPPPSGFHHDRARQFLVSGVLQGFLVIGAAVVVGYLVGRLEVLGDGATVVLSKAAFFVATPALLFTTLARADPADVFSLNLLVVGVTSAAVCLLFVPLALLRLTALLSIAGLPARDPSRSPYSV